MRFSLGRLFQTMAVVACLVAFISWNSLDGRVGTIHAMVWGASTEFAPGYTDRAFRAVTLGMAQTEVEALLGPPLAQFSAKFGSIGEWSTTQRQERYRQRVIEFEEGVVVDKRTGFEK